MRRFLLMFLAIAVLAPIVACESSESSAPAADADAAPDTLGAVDGGPSVVDGSPAQDADAAPSPSPSPDTLTTADTATDAAPDTAPDTDAVADAVAPPVGIDPTETPVALVLPVDDGEPPVLPDGVRVRALTFNIHGGGDAPAEAIGAMLAAEAPDVVALQECPPEYVAPIAAAAGLAYDSGGGGAVLLSATPLEDVRTIALPEGRNLVHARSTIDGVPFSLYAAHISWDTDGDIQARVIVDDVLTDDPLPHLVMMGDFNDEHLSTQNTILEEALVEAHTAAGRAPGERISWPAAEFDGSEGSQLIDLVFFRRGLPAIVVDAEVLALSPLLSDHKPARADLLFPRDAATPFESDPYAARRDPWRALPPEGERPANLLVNPGAEDGLDGWTPAEDGGLATDARRQLGPHTGDAFFTGPDETSVAGARAGASQTVALDSHAAAIDAARGRLYASAWMALGYDAVTAGEIVSNRLSPNDHAEVIVAVLDADGHVLRQVASGRRDPYAWFPWATAVDLPPGARAARLTWLGHQHPWHGGGNDAAFDDLYLGLDVLDAPHAVLGGDLVADGGAESGTLDAFETNGWLADDDLRIRGLMQYPPWSWSGAHHCYGGGERFRIDPGPQGDAWLARELDLAPYADVLADGALALRWGGRVRTWAAETTVTVALEIHDADGSLWGEVSAPPVVATEWTAVLQRTRIPRGTSRARLVVRAPVDAPALAAFADDLFALPERL